MRPTRGIAKESLEPTNIWERLDVRRIRRRFTLRYSRLLSRGVPSVCDFPGFWKFGSSKTDEFLPGWDFNDWWFRSGSGPKEGI
ncbi:hypothetical protein CY34DRAFT_800992 [Suillus luteus UH-Slu-Lm8-n1]|uniref:Uncharacterized protein n=1 Tax=Suillus luteus UH-Slu-Lm8-n1 TaxID=930992 RepID=A0A0D0A7A7_9AGAM|nr:hypothetical protein CY34DRAFT_800992 [Suillus luteus UH-Slu-Lm8-n1]